MRLGGGDCNFSIFGDAGTPRSFPFEEFTLQTTVPISSTTTTTTTTTATTATTAPTQTTTAPTPRTITPDGTRLEPYPLDISGAHLRCGPHRSSTYAIDNLCHNALLTYVAVMDDRVFVALHRDVQGYPPADDEELAAEEDEEEVFRICSTPTFARGVSRHDLVHVVKVGDRWFADSVVECGGHSTMRVVLFDDAAHDDLLQLGSLDGVSVDHTEYRGLFDLDVEPHAAYQPLREALDAGQASRRWDVDEANITFAHDPE